MQHILVTNYLGEEVAHRLTTIVDITTAVVLEATSHAGLVMMRALRLFKRQVLRLLRQNGVVSFERNSILRNDFLIELFFKLLLRLLASFLIGSVIFNGDWHLQHEHALGVFLRSRITIKNEALVHTASTVKLDAHQVVKHVVWQARVEAGSVEIRVLLLLALVIIGLSVIFELLDLILQLLSILIRHLHAHVDHALDGDMRHAVLRLQLLGEVSLTGRWWSREEDLEREEATEEVELIVEHLHCAAVDTTRALPLDDASKRVRLSQLYIDL